MKKIEKLKLNEMQDFTAIEKKESVSLKGGWALNRAGWEEFLWYGAGYRTLTDLTLGSGSGGSYSTMATCGSSKIVWGDDPSGTNGVNSGTAWILNQDGTVWGSYNYGSNTYFHLLSEGYVLPISL